MGAYYRFGPPNDGVYSFVLGAESGRAVSGDVIAQTNAGWFSFSFPYTAIKADTGTYANSYLSFKRTEYRSKVLYVQFPSAVTTIDHWWVTAASSIGDGLGWEALGKQTCGPFGAATQFSLEKHVHKGDDTILTSPPTFDLTALPLTGDLALKAEPAQAPWQDTCSIPDTFARAVKAVGPDWPVTASGPVLLTRRITSVVEVSVSASGSVDDVEIYQPSGVAAMDDAALLAAKRSTYAAGSILCRPTPGRYLFRADFVP
jgi:hypothetical protein